MVNAVVCSSLEKTFGEGEASVLALRKADLTIQMGELTMLVGPSGCGKTTLISVITGLLDPSAGSVEVLGTKVLDLTPEKQIGFRRKNIGFVFQQFNLLPALTAGENVAVPLFVAGWNPGPAIAKAEQVLQMLDMGNRCGSFPSQLSGGQQQRVAIARAIVHDPRLIVCDEPTSALDAKAGQRVMELLAEVAVRPGRAVIIVTHDSRVLDFADRIAHMEDGQISHVEQGAGKRTSNVPKRMEGNQ